MRRVIDELSNVISTIVKKSNEPLETKEIEEKLSNIQKHVTRTKVLYRLNNLRGDGIIRGKFVGPGKGVWIWWPIQKHTEGGKQ